MKVGVVGNLERINKFVMKSMRKKERGMYNDGEFGNMV